MLKEYETQINNIFECYFKKKLTSSEFKYHFNRVNSAWNFVRVDVKNFGTERNAIKFIEYDKNMKISYPNWSRDKYGIGSKIEGVSEKELTFIFKCEQKGKLRINLRGMDFRDLNKIRNKIYINFKRFLINGQEIFDENVLIWHNDHYIFEKKCQNDELIYVDLKFDKLFNYFPNLRLFLNKDLSHEEIQILYLKTNKIIQFEKDLLNKYLCD